MRNFLASACWVLRASRRWSVTLDCGSRVMISLRRLKAWSWASLSWISSLRVSIWDERKVEA
jgi:hypothetical protein